MVECAALEMRYTGNRIEGSNPSLSAILCASCLLAQLAVRLTLDQEVLGSIPREAANSGSWSEKLREPSPYLFRFHLQK